MMIANIFNRREVESFLRFANPQELIIEKSHVEGLLKRSPTSESEETHLKALAGRINYELRFRNKAYG